MSTVILIVHIMIAVALVGVILLQRSEGGALGIGGGGGGGGGGFMTGRSAGNALTKMTAALAACFFVTSLALGILAGTHRQPSSIIPGSSGGGGGLAPLQLPVAPQNTAPAPAAPQAPQAPQSE
jgi:preprotein translocase subunit SecG